MIANATATFIVGDSLTVLRSLPDASVDLVLTSPPFLGLRSYLPPDRPDKAAEVGSERSPGEFIDTLLDIVEECARVLAPHGSLCFELGDTYAGSGGAGGDYSPNGLREGQAKFDGTAKKARREAERYRNPAYDGGAIRDRAADTALGIRPVEVRWRGEKAGWPLDKSLCLVPELLRISLAYGFNPLTGRQTDRWRLRNVVQWCRPNPPVGALGDKFRPATSDLLVACKSRNRYFDLDAVRTPLTEPGAVKRHSTGQHNPGQGWESNNSEIRQNENGAPPLDWWEIPTQGYPGSHYATFPKALCVRPILSMCPERVCSVCGEPSRRVVEQHYERANGGTSGTRRDAREPEGNARLAGPTLVAAHRTLGWSDCGHNAYRPGVVLDPFAGSGTTLQVAHGHGRSSIGIDIDERNAELARGRLGMFLEVVERRPEVVA